MDAFFICLFFEYLFLFDLLKMKWKKTESSNSFAFYSFLSACFVLVRVYSLAAYLICFLFSVRYLSCPVCLYRVVLSVWHC